MNSELMLDVFYMVQMLKGGSHFKLTMYKLHVVSGLLLILFCMGISLFFGSLTFVSGGLLFFGSIGGWALKEIMGSMLGISPDWRFFRMASYGVIAGALFITTLCFVLLQ